jgi:hypothetical protein
MDWGGRGVGFGERERWMSEEQSINDQGRGGVQQRQRRRRGREGEHGTARLWALE